MKKKLLLSVIGIVIVLAVLGGIKALQISALIESGKSHSFPPVTVTSYEVSAQIWENSLSAVGSFEAVKGVTVSSEVSGRIIDISFTSGQFVKEGDLLVTQNFASEEAQLKEAQSEAVLAKLDLKRKSKLLSTKVIPQSDYDISKATYDVAVARSANIKSLIEKKHIRAPFSGQLGIRKINLGQNLKEGDEIVTLQSISPIHVNFSLPQNHFSKLKKDLKINVISNAIPNHIMEGVINTVSPLVDVETRNVQVQAILKNDDGKAVPGMFADISIILPAQEKVLVIPSTAVLYAPYGDSVFIIVEQEGNKIARQQFIKLDRAQGDFVTVTSGLKEHDTIVSAGAFKLQNNQAVVIDNTLAPELKLNPNPKDV